MDRGLFSQIRLGRRHYIVAATILLLFMVGMVLVQSSLLKITVLPNLGPVAQVQQPARNAAVVGSSSSSNDSLSAVRPADSYSAQLALLAQRAHQGSRYGQASTYALQIEDLAQQGRAAFAANHPGVSANAYANYLDSLRRLGSTQPAANIEKVAANEFSAYTEKLFREARISAANASALDTPGDFSEYLDSLQRLSQAVNARQSRSMDANDYSRLLDDLRRMSIK